MAEASKISNEWVTGQFVLKVNDGADPDVEPDGVAAQGRINFVASIPYQPIPVGEVNPVTELLENRYGVLDSEGYLCTPITGTDEPAYRGVRLEITNDPDGLVVDWTWNVTYALTNTKKAIAAHNFALLAGAPVDLTTVLKVPSSTGIGTEQAEALVASAAAAALSAANSSATAELAATRAADAAQATDEGVSGLVEDPASLTGVATRSIAELVAEGKLDADEAETTYQRIENLDTAGAANISAPGTQMRSAVETLAEDAANLAAGERIATIEKAAANGVATLDSTTKIPANQVPDALKPRTNVKPVGQGEFIVNVCDYGAKGDWVSGKGTGTDNLAAFQAARSAALSASTFGAVCLYVPRGKYRFSDEWDIYRPNAPRRDLVIRGESQWTTFLIADFYGAGKSLIKSRDPLGLVRSSPTSLFDVQLGTVDRNGPNPVLLDIGGHGESRLESVRFGASNNTHMALSSLQNVRYRDIVSFYGGKHFNYRDATGIAFTSTSGSSTLTASASIFVSGDAGRQIMLMRSDGVRAKYLISTYVNGTTVTISGGTPAVSLTNVPAVFEPARITTEAGSNQVSANAQVFTADDIGRIIYIWGAANGAFGAGMLRARITELVSSATVKIDVTADRSVTRTEFASPAIDLYAPSSFGAISANSNDVKIDWLHIENFAGVGLAVESSEFMHINKMKIHGEHAPTSSWASLAHMWLDDYSGTISGDLDGAATGDHRIALCNMGDMLTFEYLATRQVYNEKTFQVDLMTSPGGIAEVRSINVYSGSSSNATASADPYLLVGDANTEPRLLFTGLVNVLGDSLPPRIYSGKSTYFTTLGEMITKSPDGTKYRINIANGGEISTTVVS